MIASYFSTCRSHRCHRNYIPLRFCLSRATSKIALSPTRLLYSPYTIHVGLLLYVRSTGPPGLPNGRFCRKNWSMSPLLIHHRLSKHVQTILDIRSCGSRFFLLSRARSSVLLSLSPAVQISQRVSFPPKVISRQWPIVIFFSVGDPRSRSHSQLPVTSTLVSRVLITYAYIISWYWSDDNYLVLGFSRC